MPDLDHALRSPHTNGRNRKKTDDHRGMRLSGWIAACTFIGHLRRFRHLARVESCWRDPVYDHRKLLRLSSDEEMCHTKDCIWAHHQPQALETSRLASKSRPTPDADVHAWTVGLRTSYNPLECLDYGLWSGQNFLIRAG